MAKKNKLNKVWMVPEEENKAGKSYSYHFVHAKTLNQIRNGVKLRMKRYNPAKRQHEYFVERRMPPHSK